MESREYIFNQSVLRIFWGNILATKAAVIVSSDDCYLTQGGGVSKAIASAAGKVMMVDQKKMIPARLGDVVVTSAGELPQKYIFHCITISDDMNDDFALFSSEEDYYRFIVGRAMDQCFRLINLLDIPSIAFPCIGAGVAGIPIETVAEIMADRISANMLRTNKSYQIELYLYDRFGEMDTIDFIPVFEKYAVASALTALKIKQEMDLFTDDRVNGVIETGSDSGMDNMSHQVFISYSRHDSEILSQIRSILDTNGISYWIDTDGMHSRGSFKSVLVDAIRTSDAVIFLSSKNSNASEFVAKEISLAVSYKKMIIPLMLDNTPFTKSIEFDLKDIDQLDFHGEFEKKLLDNLFFAIGRK